jgi:hypothetical protein
MAKRASLAGPLPAPTAPRRATEAGGSSRNSRAGRTGISFWVDPAAHRQLRHLAIDTGQSVQALMEQALDLLLEEHGKARVASPPGRSRTAA